MRRMIGAFVVSVLLAPTTLAGQACVGGPSFKDGNMRLGAGARFEDGAKSYGAQFATGSATGGFAQAGLSTVQYDDVSGTGAIVDVTGGWAIDLVPTSKAQFCPLVGFSYQNGPNISSSFGDVSVSAHAFGIGGALGGVAMTSPGFDFVPFAGFTYFLASGTASVAGFSDTQNQNYGELTLGSGFVLNRALTIQPTIHIPVGLDDSKTSFGIALAFNFGTRASK